MGLISFLSRFSLTYLFLRLLKNVVGSDQEVLSVVPESFFPLESRIGIGHKCHQLEALQLAVEQKSLVLSHSGQIHIPLLRVDLTDHSHPVAVAQYNQSFIHSGFVNQVLCSLQYAFLLDGDSPRIGVEFDWLPRPAWLDRLGERHVRLLHRELENPRSRRKSTRNDHLHTPFGSALFRCETRFCSFTVFGTCF